MRVDFGGHNIWEGFLSDAIHAPTASGFKLEFKREDEFGNDMTVSIEFDKMDIQKVKNLDLFNDSLI